jgi:hypothetical protein
MSVENDNGMRGMHMINSSAGMRSACRRWRPDSFLAGRWSKFA